MPSFEQHCRESVELFGKRYEEVHRVLDEFEGAPDTSATAITSSPAPHGLSAHIVLQYGEMAQTMADFSREKREIAERMIASMASSIAAPMWTCCGIRRGSSIGCNVRARSYATRSRKG